MTPLAIGILIAIGTIVVLASGVPIAFGLGLVSIIFLLIFDGFGSLNILADTIFAGIAEFSLVSIPMFIVMGAAVASSPAGKDLYEALDRWLYRIPGGLIMSNIGACAIFAALSGSSPATCAAIGKMGVPEMRKRGYPDGLATGSIAAGGTLGILIPPSVTMIVYGIATETSIGRLFIAGLLPGLLLTALFVAWSMFTAWRNGFSFNISEQAYSLKQKLEVMPRVLPFLIIIAGVLFVLYGGVATPSEAAGVAALFVLVLVAVIYRIWQPDKIWKIINSSMKESVMIMMIIAASALFAYTLSSLYVTQSVAEYIANMEVNRWVLMALINVFLLVAGFFLPPVAVIVMTAPILLPIIEAVGFDPYWFAVVFTINMEIGLITPPVGLNLYVINGIAPDVPLPTVLKGSIPYVLCMILAIIILCVFPEIATWLPTALMGEAIF
jgi:C4-dicarboxylate transporter DctM subunit